MAAQCESSSRLSAVEMWKRKVEAARLQLASRRQIPEAAAPGDRVYGRRLRSAALERRPTGLLMELLDEHVGSDATVIDVGAGPGRYTIPLAEMARAVIAVEPSPIMTGYLRENLTAKGIGNVSIVPRRWEDAEVPMADFVVCSHVLYNVLDIGEFLLKLDAHAQRGCFIVHHRQQFDHLAGALWPLVHGEPLAPPPVFASLLDVLAEVGIGEFRTGVMPAFARMTFEDAEEAVDYCLERLALMDTEDNRALLRPALAELLERVDDRVGIPPQPPSGVVWWLKGRDDAD